MVNYYFIMSVNICVCGWVKIGFFKKSIRFFINFYNVVKFKFGYCYVYGVVGLNMFDCFGYIKYVF